MICARCGTPLYYCTRSCPRCGEPAVLRDTPFNLLQPAPPRPAAPVQVADTYAWGLAFLPLLMVLLDMLFVLVAVGRDLAGWSTLATLATNTALAVLDSRRLQGAGVALSAWWGILVVPVYLVKRTRLTGSTPAIPLAWVASVVAYLAATTVLLA